MSVDTVRRPHTCVEETQIVIDFSRRSHRRARIFTSRFLVDGNSWAETINGIYIWFFHISQELTSVGGQTLYIATLSLRIESIKSQTGLP
ncbi:Uncharacterised protein [Streptococcus pneumoniae]|nr:Uncharacterised protein [Streptococcus pneumoniae]